MRVYASSIYALCLVCLSTVYLDDGLVGVGHGAGEEAHEGEGQHLVLEAQLSELQLWCRVR